MGILLAGTIGFALMIGCGATSSGATRFSVPQQTQGSAPAFDEVGTPATDAADLIDRILMIYCGAGITRPSQEVAGSFKSTINCEINVTYASAGQVQPQITTFEEGDMFIAGSAEELKLTESYVSGSRVLVKHIPILAVQSNNPESTTSLSGLAAEGVSLITSGADSIPIGKIARKALGDAGILDKVQIVASTAAVPQMATAIAAEETNVTIIWKENCDAEGVGIVDNGGLEDYIKTAPAASLICSADHDARQALLDYLDPGKTWEIWIMYGYEITE